MSQDTYFYDESNRWKISFLRILTLTLTVLLSGIFIWRRITIGSFYYPDLALSAIITAHASLYIVARKGWMKTASIGLITITFMAISLMVFTGKGVYDSAAASYIALIVITSYSIHYTKLYDKCCMRLTIRTCRQEHQAWMSPN